MSVTLAPEAPPLTMDEHGRIRVAGTRVFLEFVVSAHKRGLSAEQIAELYDVLTLADVYGAVGYYLRHQGEVEACLDRCEVEAREVHERIEKTQPPFPSKAELLARRRPSGS
jgi:uncharacterized protein (DUF433 family)